MKPIKVDKETQKKFEEFAEYENQNEALLYTLMTTMNRINGRLFAAKKELWADVSKKYKLNPKLNHIYNRLTKELMEKECDDCECLEECRKEWAEQVSKRMKEPKEKQLKR
jgi:hypothetical protein